MGGRGSSSKLSSKSRGEGAPFSVSLSDGFAWRTGKLTSEDAKEFFNRLIAAGVFGTEEQFDEAIKNAYTWRSMEWRRQWAADGDDSYKEVDLDTYLNADSHDAAYMYISFEDYKRMQLENIANSFREGGPRYFSGIGGDVPGTLSEGFKIYYGGASKYGYGRGADARIKWDEKYEFSKMIDSHPELQFSTKDSLYRGLRLSDKSMKDLFKLAGTDNTMDFKGPSSWSTDTEVAEKFVEYSLVGKRNKNLVIFEEVGKGRRTAMPYYYGFDSEVIYSGTAKFKVLSIKQDEEGIYRVKVKEVKR